MNRMVKMTLKIVFWLYSFWMLLCISGAPCHPVHTGMTEAERVVLASTNISNRSGERETPVTEIISGTTSGSFTQARNKPRIRKMGRRRFNFRYRPG